MSLISVSDLHISSTQDPLYRSLLSLIETRLKSGDIFVLAGDIFDLFVGNKKVFVGRYQEFFDSLQAASVRGVKIHYIEGNHDFQIKHVFSRIEGLQVHPRDVLIEMNGKRFFFSHGDLVDPKDYGYFALRAFLRSPVMKAFVTVMPGRVIAAIGNAMSATSQKKGPRLPANLPTPQMERLRILYRSFAAEKLSQGYDFVVMGHCHDLDEMQFNIGGRPGQYINIGYPRAHGSFVSWHEGDAVIGREKMPEA